MKRKLTRSLICLVLTVALAMVPVSGMAASSLAYLLKVTTTGARLREGPSSSYDVVQSLKKGTVVLYLGSYSDAFCKIYTSGGSVGYIYKGYLGAYGRVKKSQIYVANERATVYKRSGSSLRKYGTMSKGQLVLVYAVRGNWAYIKNMNGKGGYVKKSTLSKAF